MRIKRNFSKYYDDSIISEVIGTTITIADHIEQLKQIKKSLVQFSGNPYI